MHAVCSTSRGGLSGLSPRLRGSSIPPRCVIWHSDLSLWSFEEGQLKVSREIITLRAICLSSAKCHGTFRRGVLIHSWHVNRRGRRPATRLRASSSAALWRACVPSAPPGTTKVTGVVSGSPHCPCAVAFVSLIQRLGFTKSAYVPVL